MKICFVVLLSGITLVLNSITAKAADACMQWQCQTELGGDLNGTARICADSTGNLASTNVCQPDDSFLCDVGTQLETQTNCSESSPFPWKTNLAPGDNAETKEQCAAPERYNAETKVCQGLAANATCTMDIECNAGFTCNRGNMTCVATVSTGESCTADVKCDFGHVCAYGTCQRFGSIPTGSNVTFEDNELAADQVADNSAAISFGCASFVARKTAWVNETTNLPIYQCIAGYEKNFTDYANAEPTVCKYTINYGNGTKGQTGDVEEPAVCGYNLDNKIYCPMKRSEMEHQKENEAAASTWSTAPNTCHVRSSVQYCNAIEGDILKSVPFRAAAESFWRTSGNNYPLIANSNRCIGNSIKATRAYWRIVDSATGTILSYFGVIASLFVLTLAY